MFSSHSCCLCIKFPAPISYQINLISDIFFFSIIRTRWRKKRISHGTWKTFPVFLHPMEDISSSGSSSGSNDLIWRLTRDSQKNRMIEFRSNGFFQFSLFSYLFHLLQKKLKWSCQLNLKFVPGHILINTTQQSTQSKCYAIS